MCRCLSGWPFQLSAAQNMDVQMINTLASLSAVINNQTKTIWGFFFAQLTGNLHQMAQKLNELPSKKSINKSIN